MRSPSACSHAFREVGDSELVKFEMAVRGCETRGRASHTEEIAPVHLATEIVMLRYFIPPV